MRWVLFALLAACAGCEAKSSMPATVNAGPSNPAFTSQSRYESIQAGIWIHTRMQERIPAGARIENFKISFVPSDTKKMACGFVAWDLQGQSGRLPFIADVTDEERSISTDSEVIDEKMKELGLEACPG